MEMEKSKMKISEVIIKEMEESIQEFEAKIRDRVDRRDRLLNSSAVQKLEELLAPMDIDVGFSAWSYARPTLVLVTKSIEETRKLATKLLEEVEEVREFRKEFVNFDEGRNVALWREITQIGNDLDVEIGPAEPSPDCEPVKRVNSYTSWSCEKVR